MFCIVYAELFTVIKQNALLMYSVALDSELVKNSIVKRANFKYNVSLFLFPLYEFQNISFEWIHIEN